MALKNKLTHTKIVYFANIFIFFTICLALPVSFTLKLGPFGTGLPSPWATFNIPERNLEIDYPKRWYTYAVPNGNHGDTELIVQFSYPSLLSPHVNIAYRKIAGKDFNEVVSWGKTRIKWRDEYIVLSEIPYNTNSFRGKLFEYQTGNSIDSAHCMDWYIIDDISGYDLSFCVNKKEWLSGKEMFLHMVNSLQHIKD